MNLRELIDSYHGARAFRLQEERRIRELKETETSLKDKLMEKLRTEQLTAAGGTTHQVKIVSKDEPQVEDWEALQKHIQKTGQFELLQKRIGVTAIRERWDDAVEVPGVIHFPTESLSLTKL